MRKISRFELRNLAAAAIAARRPMWPIETDRSPVKVSGEPLHAILWRGRQWAVTAYGIEALDGGYAIKANRLREDFGSGFHEWPAHMSEKDWVDVDDFATAWMVALVLHHASTEGAEEAIGAAFRHPVN